MALAWPSSLPLSGSTLLHFALDPLCFFFVAPMNLGRGRRLPSALSKRAPSDLPVVHRVANACIASSDEVWPTSAI